MSSTTGELAKFVSRLSLDDVPTRVALLAKRQCLDLVGVGLIDSLQDPGVLAMKYALLSQSAAQSEHLGDTQAVLRW
jgi:2-methylcitrate dehydratase PrpD